MLSLSEIESMNLTQLCQAAKHRHIKNFSSMNKELLKEKLIEFVMTQSVLPVSSYVSNSTTTTTPSLSSLTVSKRLKTSDLSQLVLPVSLSSIVLPKNITMHPSGKYEVKISYRAQYFQIGLYEDFDKAKEDLDFVIKKKNEFDNSKFMIVLDKYDFIEESRWTSLKGILHQEHTK